MIAAPKTSREQLLKTWNSSVMSYGQLDDGQSRADAGSVIPGVLTVFGSAGPGFACERATLLVCGARNLQHSRSMEHRRAWQKIFPEKSRSRFRPDEPLSMVLLSGWSRLI